jgi:integrase
MLYTLQRSMVDERDEDGGRLSRVTINVYTTCIRTAFKWGAHFSRELVPLTVFSSLAVVEAIKPGETSAPERPPVEPVSDDVVDKTLPHRPPMIADMIMLQRLTGARPGEILRINWGEIDRRGETWRYSPKRHKMAHRGKERHVFIGPKAQSILMRYVNVPDGEPIFKPGAGALAAANQNRKQLLAQIESQLAVTPAGEERTKLIQRRWHLQNVPLTEERARGTKAYHYNAYATAIRRGCKAAGVPEWAPNRLRHSAATQIREDAEFGLEGASALLGHSDLTTTQIYAQRSKDLAARVAKKHG